MNVNGTTLRDRIWVELTHYPGKDINQKKAKKSEFCLHFSCQSAIPFVMSEISILLVIAQRSTHYIPFDLNNANLSHPTLLMTLRL